MDRMPSGHKNMDCHGASQTSMPHPSELQSAPDELQAAPDALQAAPAGPLNSKLGRVMETPTFWATSLATAMSWSDSLCMKIQRLRDHLLHVGHAVGHVDVVDPDCGGLGHKLGQLQNIGAHGHESDLQQGPVDVVDALGLGQAGNVAQDLFQVAAP